MHEYTIFALEGIYLTNNNNNKTKTKTKQKRERQKEKRKGTEQDSNPAPCQKLYEQRLMCYKLFLRYAFFVWYVGVEAKR